jgi:hypothetical protein
MELPKGPVTLTVGQVEELSQKLSKMRHDVNGDLAVLVASAELMKLSPESAQRMLKTLMEQPEKVRQKIEAFSGDFEKTLGIRR